MPIFRLVYLLISLELFREILRTADEVVRACVARHSEISSRRERNRTYFYAVRDTITLVLLAEKSLIKRYEPFLYSLFIVFAVKSFVRESVNLFGSKAEAERVIYIKVVNSDINSPFISGFSRLILRRFRRARKRRLVASIKGRIVLISEFCGDR